MKQCWCGNENLIDYCESYFLCEKCGSLVTKENISVSTLNVDDNTDFYGKSYWEELMMSRAHTSNCGELIDLYLGERAPYWLGSLYKYLLPGQGNVAEIGCGMGQFTYLLKCSGYKETGFDLSPTICDYISKELSINIINSSFVRSENKYDAIVAMDLLEHLEQPVQFIQDVYSSLKDNGIILFQTPCFNNKTDYETIVNENPRFLSLMSPNEHLVLFSRKSISKLLKDAGFKDILFLDAYFGNNYDMFVVSSKNKLHEYTDYEIKSELYKQPYGRVLNALIETADKKTKLEALVNAIDSDRQIYINRDLELSSKCKKYETDQDWLLEQLAIAMENKLNPDNDISLSPADLLENEDDCNNIRYSDGWIGKFYSEVVNLNVRDNQLNVLGKNLLFEDGDIEMTVYIDGKYAGRQNCSYGEFSISVPIDRPRNKAEVSLLFNKTISPAAKGTSEDYRNLSVILISIFGQNK